MFYVLIKKRLLDNFHIVCGILALLEEEEKLF